MAKAKEDKLTNSKSAPQVERARDEGRDLRDAQGAEGTRSERSDTQQEVQERVIDFRTEWLQEALPRIPAKPGWHRCWLSTTNQFDPIHKRIRLGYRPVKVDDIPELEAHRVHSGEHAGFISVNEMLLFEIPDELYQQIMRHFHHDLPLQEEEAIRVRMDQLREETKDSAGNKLVSVEEGTSELGRHKRPQIFT